MLEDFEKAYAREHITVLVDTREQDTPRLRRRLEAIGLPYVRQKLDFGDYSAKCYLSDGRELDFSGSLAIERKMSIDELCACYCGGRDRFTREFERAREAEAKVYLLIENATWEKVFGGKYRSRMNPKALKASLLTWLARYNCQLIFCKEETSGMLIAEILKREVNERLEKDI